VDQHPARLPSRWPRLLTIAVFGATLLQLAIGTFVSGLPQFEGKGFGARLVAYPLMMLLVPAVWLGRGGPARQQGGGRVEGAPWTAFGLIMAPFLVDVTGNTLDLYDSVTWWDDANHFVNWFLLCLGIGLLMARSAITIPWVLGLLVAGIGAMLAVVWEVGEWYTFIRHGTELATAYEDTLFDEVLGTLGAAFAGALIAWRAATEGPRPRWNTAAAAGQAGHFVERRSGLPDVSGAAAHLRRRSSDHPDRGAEH
jgi:hypothetical protein